MNHLARYKQQLSGLIFLAVFTPAFVSLACFVFLRELAEVPLLLSGLVTGGVLAVSLAGTYWLTIRLVRAPAEKIWQAMLHISPHRASAAAPRLEKMGLGRELVSSIILQIYNLASNSPPSSAEQPKLDTNSLSEALPLPLLVLDKNRVIVQTNQLACTYLGQKREHMVGKPVHDVLRMSFSNTSTFSRWLDEVSASRATASQTWEHVRIETTDSTPARQFDLAASYSKDNSSGFETVLAVFDKSAAYESTDNSTSYVAMAVHELRTPLTVLRGYIEVFEEELGGQLNPEMQEFLRKMKASAQSLTAFVSNILNVARIDENQMTLALHEADWGSVITGIIKDLELRAAVRGKTIKLEIEPGLPKVAIDKISMYEVVSNLIDNAVKYSGMSKEIVVSVKKSQDNTVHTVVQDYGVGIPESAIKHLFTKYYRSHRSKNAVSGSGLGLYLVKSIVDAHGGTVWVNSKAGEGSSFGFSLQTYATASQAAKQATDGIERHASGWIKNHSLYRN